MTQRDVYVAKMKLQLDELNAKMTALEAQARVARTEARDKYQAEMTKLALKSKEAGLKLDQMVSAGEDTWEAMVAEMEKVRDASTSAYNHFKSQL